MKFQIEMLLLKLWGKDNFTIIFTQEIISYMLRQDGLVMRLLKLQMIKEGANKKVRQTNDDNVGIHTGHQLKQAVGDTNR